MNNWENYNTTEEKNSTDVHRTAINMNVRISGVSSLCYSIMVTTTRTTYAFVKYRKNNIITGLYELSND